MDMDTQTVSAGPGTHGRRDDAGERAQAWREPRPVQSLAASSRPDATDGTAAIISTQRDTVNATARVAHGGPSARR
eukprot:1329869-Prymnesium_polylepis.1